MLIKQKPDNNLNDNNEGIFLKEVFLRVLDRAIKPPDQENQRTSEKSDSGLLVVKGYSPIIIYD